MQYIYSRLRPLSRVKTRLLRKIGAEANYKLTRPSKPVQKNIEFIDFI